MVKVLFRVDAGPQIGLGHLQRSLSLALALRTLGVESVFLTNEDKSSQKRAESHGFTAKSLPAVRSWTSKDMESSLELAHHSGCQTILVDSHEVGEDYLAQLRSSGLFVIARDDLALHPFSCQMVFNGNADAGQLPYRSSSGDTRFLLGPEYAVLRAEYSEVPSRKIPASVDRVQVILGGADSTNLMPGILSLLDEIPADFSVAAIVGPFFDNLDNIQATVDNSKRRMSLVHSPDSVKDLMLDADLAISAAGQTLYELACTGCPTLAIKVASNQERQMRAMESNGFIQVVPGETTEDVLANLKTRLLPLLGDTNARTAMAAAGQRMVDGLGGLRVAREICSLAY